MSIIRVEDLIKEFRTPKRRPGLLGAARTLFTRESVVARAVDGVSFTLGEGELVGYLGPNGAGKSTTIKMLTGILVPTSGTIVVDGLVPWRDREQNALNIGVVFGQRTQLWWDLPLVESFKLIAKMYRVPADVYRRNLDAFVDLLEMGSFLTTPVRQLSLGQRMRGDLVAAMLYEPRILYLDEPTVGLDVVAKERIREFIAASNRERRTTVILTTHDIDDVERLCPRVILIDQGRVLFDGSVDRLKSEYAPYRILTVKLASDGADVGPGSSIEVPGTEVVRRDGLSVTFRFDPARQATPAVINAVTARYPIVDLSVSEPDLESVLRQMYAERRVAP